MKKFVSVCGVMFFLLAAFSCRAQQLKLDLNYGAGIPVGNLRTLVSNASPRGLEGSLMYDIDQKVAVGLSISTQDFYQKYPRTVLHMSGSDVSAVVSNSIQVNPVMVGAKYRFGQPGHIQPYIALAAGADFAHYSKYYGEFADDNSHIGFAARAGVGIFIPIASYRVPGFHIGADYNYLPYQNADANGFSFVGIKAGLSIVL